MGATAGVSVLTAMLLLTALTAYEVAGVRHERAQARALAAGTLLQLQHAMATGALPLPAPGTEVEVRNGAVAGGPPVDVATFPAPPVDARWPARSQAAEFAPGGGHGAAVVLRRLVGPDGTPVPGTAAGTWLLHVEVTAWFRRGLAGIEQVVAVAGDDPAG